MAVTIYDVAKAAGVGIGTVSRVLNDNANVSAQTRRKVLDTIEALGYKPNFMARNLSRSHLRTVGVVLSYLTNPFQVAVLQGIEQTLSQAEVDLIIFNLDSQDRRNPLLERLSEGRRSDGLIVISFSLPPKFIERFRRYNIPVVITDNLDTHLPSVYVDNVYGGYLATSHLLSLGHRRIAYIQDHFKAPNGPDGNWPGLDRRRGYAKALLEVGIEVDLNLICEGDGHSRRRGWQAANELLNRPDPPGAIFAASDMLALGVIEYAQSHGIRIPEDLALVGFDDIELASFAGLTTVRQPMHQMGSEAAKMVIDLMNGKTLTEQHRELSLELIIRNSSGTPQAVRS
ncbi:MAG: LacI family DNA-binding transcriptional regulator [Caldilineaceae bacterium]